MWNPVLKHFFKRNLLLRCQTPEGHVWFNVISLSLMCFFFQLLQGLKTPLAKEPYWANAEWAWNIPSLMHISILGMPALLKHASDPFRFPVHHLTESFICCSLDFPLQKCNISNSEIGQWAVCPPLSSATRSRPWANSHLGLPSWQFVFVSSTIILFIYLASAVKSGQRSMHSCSYTMGMDFLTTGYICSSVHREWLKHIIDL